MSGDRLKRGFASAAKYCAFRERAPKEVFDKLLSWEFSEEEASQIIAELKAEKYLDEVRFARAFCHDKFQFNHWGKIKIRLEISQFDLNANIIEDSMEAINAEKYLEILTQLAQKKWSLIQHKGEDFTQRRKVADYLLRKGFEGDLVWKVVKGLASQNLESD
jgi:regulatory protein